MAKEMRAKLAYYNLQHDEVDRHHLYNNGEIGHFLTVTSRSEESEAIEEINKNRNIDEYRKILNGRMMVYVVAAVVDQKYARKQLIGLIEESDYESWTSGDWDTKKRISFDNKGDGDKMAKLINNLTDQIIARR